MTMANPPMEIGERYSVEYCCRFDAGEGDGTFTYMGVETFGKHILEPVDDGPTVYLFDDEIVSVRRTVMTMANPPMDGHTNDELAAIIYGAPDLANVRGTVWGAVQAFAAFSDHNVPSRTTDRNTAAANRQRRIWFDTSIKDMAAELIYAAADIKL